MAERPKHWLVQPDTIRWLWMISIVVLIVVVLWELLLHRHPYFSVDKIFGFNAWFGFLSCAGMVVFAKGLGYLIKRPDTYYDYETATPMDSADAGGDDRGSDAKDREAADVD